MVILSKGLGTIHLFIEGLFPNFVQNLQLDLVLLVHGHLPEEDLQMGLVGLQNCLIEDHQFTVWGGSDHLTILVFPGKWLLGGTVLHHSYLDLLIPGKQILVIQGLLSLIGAKQEGFFSETVGGLVLQILEKGRTVMSSLEGPYTLVDFMTLVVMGMWKIEEDLARGGDLSVHLSLLLMVLVVKIFILIQRMAPDLLGSFRKIIQSSMKELI
jgi:hypothetical protein